MCFFFIGPHICQTCSDHASNVYHRFGRRPNLIFYWDVSPNHPVLLPRCMECRRGLAMRILSVRRSVCRTRALWQNGRKICLDFTPYEISFSLVLWEKEWLGGETASAWKFGSTGPRWSEIADFEQIIARSASAVTPSEKSSIDTNRKYTMRLPMSLL